MDHDLLHAQTVTGYQLLNYLLKAVHGMTKLEAQYLVVDIVGASEMRSSLPNGISKLLQTPGDFNFDAILNTTVVVNFAANYIADKQKACREATQRVVRKYFTDKKQNQLAKLVD